MSNRSLMNLSTSSCFSKYLNESVSPTHIISYCTNRYLFFKNFITWNWTVGIQNECRCWGPYVFVKNASYWQCITYLNICRILMYIYWSFSFFPYYCTTLTVAVQCRVQQMSKAVHLLCQSHLRHHLCRIALVLYIKIL